MLGVQLLFSGPPRVTTMDNLTPSNVDLGSLYNLILKSNAELATHIDTKVNGLQQHIDSSLGNLNEQLEHMQTRVSANEDNIHATQDKVLVLEKRIQELEKKQQRIEDNQRAKNLRLIALPEGSEHADLPGFLSRWIPQLLGEDNFRLGLVIERAWRIPNPAHQRQKPRPILLSLQNISERRKIQDLARKKRDLLFKNQPVFFFPDYPAETLKKRKEFDGVKETLKAMGIKAALLYPAKMRVFGEVTQTFTSPSAVERYIEQIRAPAEPSRP